jgi:DNA-binding transcriptional ArsR family regulator
MVTSVLASSPRLDAVFHALSDSTRRSILRDVSGREKTVTEIALPYQMSLAAVSKHLKVLERAGLIQREKRGSFQFVQVNAKPMQEAGQWLAYYEQFWDDRLELLQKQLSKMSNE